jgi:hypothetical protein
MKVGIVVPYSWSFGGGVVDHADAQRRALAREADGFVATLRDADAGYLELVLSTLEGAGPSAPPAANTTETGQFHNTDVHPTVPMPGPVSTGPGTTFGVPTRSP